MAGKTGHPLPGSGEARHNEIPESAGREKGRGDDSPGIVQPDGDPVKPDGEPYRYDDLGRGPGSAARGDDELLRDQRAHQDRGQGALDDEAKSDGS